MNEGIEYVTLDYDGEPVVIEDGEIYDEYRDYWDSEAGRFIDLEWNSETCEWEEPETDYCSSDWDDVWDYKPRKGALAEQREEFYKRLF